MENNISRFTIPTVWGVISAKWLEMNLIVLTTRGCPSVKAYSYPKGWFMAELTLHEVSY